jgi:hypothetical protein
MLPHFAMVDSRKNPPHSNTKSTYDSLKKTLKDKKKKHNEYKFHKNVRMCELHISLGLRALLEKIDLFKK